MTSGKNPQNSTKPYDPGEDPDADPANLTENAGTQPDQAEGEEEDDAQ